MLNPASWPGTSHRFRRTVRIGVTGLARAGKTALLTSVWANLLALNRGRAALPALGAVLAGRPVRVVAAPMGAGELPPFDAAGHLAALTADPPCWPARTGTVSLLALDLDIGRSRYGLQLPPRRLRLELLDYPGEWLLDLPLLRQGFPAWSQAVFQRLQRGAAAPLAKEFLAFATALPVASPADEALAAQGHRLYAALLHRLRDAGLSLLQPGRVLMPAAGDPPPWTVFFPYPGTGGLAQLLAERYDRYAVSVRNGLESPLFGSLDRLVVLADLLGALHRGSEAFADASAALGAASGALNWRGTWSDALAALLRLRLPTRISRVAWVATKADHVASGQRGNLAALLGALTGEGDANSTVPSRRFAVAAIRCTRDGVMSLGGRSVSAVEGRIAGQGLVRSYPGEVPPGPPTPAFWAGEFYAMPDFQPPRLSQVELGVPQIGLDELLAYLLDDLL